MEKIGLVLFAAFILGLILLDLGMVVSLVVPGDERKQMIVWKASAYTLLGVTGSLILNIVQSLIQMHPVLINPFIKLGSTATIYFAFLLYYKRKYGG